MIISLSSNILKYTIIFCIWFLTIYFSFFLFWSISVSTFSANFGYLCFPKSFIFLGIQIIFVEDFNNKILTKNLFWTCNCVSLPPCCLLFFSLFPWSDLAKVWLLYYLLQKLTFWLLVIQLSFSFLFCLFCSLLFPYSLCSCLFFLTLFSWTSFLFPKTFINGYKLFHSPALLAGEGSGTPLQYSCLENPRDGGA